MPVITISRQLGSLGTQIAARLSESLKCTYLDKAALEQKFEEFGISHDSVEKYDEKKPGFWDLFKTDKARYIHYMLGIIYQFARKGSCIILGRGGQMVLNDLPGVMNVRIIAPMEVRVARVIESYKCDEHHAEELIISNDRERSGFHKFFFGEDWEDVSLYDLVINTGFFSIDSAVKIIMDAAKTDEFKHAQKETKIKLADRCLEHEIKTIILYQEKIGVQFLEVAADQGLIILRGIVASETDVERCQEITAKVKDVKEVRNEIYYKPITSTYGLHY